jgi:hypothetical protein
VGKPERGEANGDLGLKYKEKSEHCVMCMCVSVYVPVRVCACMCAHGVCACGGLHACGVWFMHMGCVCTVCTCVVYTCWCVCACVCHFHVWCVSIMQPCVVCVYVHKHVGGTRVYKGCVHVWSLHCAECALCTCVTTHVCGVHVSV